MTSRTFGIWSPFVGGDYYGAIISGVNAAAVSAGDRVMAVQTLDPGSYSADRSGVPDFRRPVAWRHVSGLVVLPGAVDAAYAVAARRAGKPVVSVGHDLGDCSAVLVDNRSGVRQAVAHLVGHGHERIAFAGNLAAFDIRERYEGFREGLLAHGLTPRPEWLFDNGDNHEGGGESTADELIRADLPVTAIVLGTDRNAAGLIERLVAAGYEVPRDIAVVGFDDIPDATYTIPSLATVHQPLDQVGAAVHTLIRELADDPSLPRQVRQVPTTFVQRDSCGCPPTGLPVSEARTRDLFAQVRLLQATLNIQYELGIDLLGTLEQQPRALAWLNRTPAVGGHLGLWQPAGPLLEVVGEYRPGGGRSPALATALPVEEFPPADLFTLADGAAGDIVFVVPVRSTTRDWGLLAAVTRIQSSTPPGREMMNQSGALLAAALDHDAMVASLREKEEELRDAALHDHLTGLPNRVLLEDRLNQARLRAARHPEHRYAVLLLDLDGFKAVNDSFGHATGDELLVQVGRRLTGMLRKVDTVARLGGDEFVVLLDGVSEPNGQQVVSDSIRKVLTEPYLIDGRLVAVGLSIGVALSTDFSTDPEHLLREADAAMYRAKLAGRRR